MKDDSRANEDLPGVAEAIRELGGATKGAAHALTYALHDAASTVSESVRSAATSILAVLTSRPPNGKAEWTETDARYARSKGGRLRPVSDKTEAEKATLARMRSRKASEK
jgi:hypothetical protein